MGLAISLVATEKEKVGLILRASLFCSYVFWEFIQNTKANTDCGANRCGTTFVRTEAEAATTPGWRRTEAAPSGTMRKRWDGMLTQTLHETLNVKAQFYFRPLKSVVSPFSNHTQLLSDIEEHLKCTITQCEPDIKIPVDEFDGKVTYGQRRALGGPYIARVCTQSTSNTFDLVSRTMFLIQVVHAVTFKVPHLMWCWFFPGGNYKGHVDVLAPTVSELANLEREAQSSFLHLGYLPNQLFKAFWRRYTTFTLHSKATLL